MTNLTLAFAGSMILNYRGFYKEVYEVESTLSDEQILNIINTVFVDGTTDDQDEARVEAMRELEEGANAT